MLKVYSFINFSRTIAYNFVIWPFCGTNILHAENDLNTLHATAKIKSLFIRLQLSNALPFDITNFIIIMK